MESLNEVEKAITYFSKKELQSFREWFEEFDSTIWDKQLENNILSGKLDKLGSKALGFYSSNNVTEL